MVSTNISTPTLQIGASGSAVRDLQDLLLKNISISGLTVDGDFGQITELAVEVFQYRNFLEDDGVVGPLTWRVLLNGGLGHLPLLRRGDRNITVERLQRALTLGEATGPLNEAQEIAGTRGFYFGAIDGDFGPMTERAVILFQQSSPFGRPPLAPADGIVGAQTWNALAGMVARISHHFL